MTAALIELRAITRQFGSDSPVFALRGVDLTVAPGEFVAIAGRSGSGKSTLLNVLGLLDRPTAGQYLLDTEDVTSHSESGRDEVRGREFGFVFQDAYGLDERDVARNVELPLLIQGVPEHERARRVAEALRTVGMQGLRDRLVKNLSGGERQRMAIARALVHRPALLLVDEPTGNLDSVNAEAIHDLLTQLNLQGVTIVVVTHDDRLAQIASRQVRIRDGRVVADTGMVENPARSASPRSSAARSSKWSRTLDGAAEALRSISERGAKSLLNVAVIALGVAGVVAGVGVTESADARVSEAFNAAASDEVRIAGREGSTSFAVEDVAVAEKVTGVVSAGLMSSTPAPPIRVSRLASGIPTSTTYRGTLLAVTPGTLTAFGITTAHCYDAILSDEVLARRSVLLGTVAAATLGVSSYGPGTTLWIQDRPFTVAGIVRPDEKHEAVATSVIVSHLARDSLRIIDPSVLVVNTDPGMAPAVANALPLALDPGAPERYVPQSTADLAELRSSVDESLAWVFFVMAAILLLVAVLATSSAMGNSVLARRREIGLRRAIGTSRRGIAWLFLNEGLAIGLLGALWGAAIGVIALVTLSIVQGWPLHLGPAPIAIALVSGLLAGAIGSALPATRASRFDPALALRG